MPYLHIATTESIAALGELREEIAALMPILPTKNRENTMIHIVPDSFMAMGDADQPCIFVDLRLYGPSPLAAKQDFTAKLCALLHERLGIASNRMYMNVIELESWGAGGALKTL